MSDSNVIRLHRDHGSEVPPSTEVREGLAKVLPLRAANDRRGKYAELRALIDAGVDLDVWFETIEEIPANPAR
jgi:hypothetical protein